MKVLFLDIDGVLNSWDWWKRRPETKLGHHHDAGLVSEFQIDPDAVERLNRVLERTGAFVCVSSTWRLGPVAHWREVQWMLRHRGLRGRIIGRTPNHCRRIPDGMVLSAVRRGIEIQDWLDHNPEVERFAIVDDDADMAHLGHRLVRTTMEHGLTDVEVEQLIEMLGPKTSELALKEGAER